MSGQATRKSLLAQAAGRGAEEISKASPKFGPQTRH